MASILPLIGGTIQSQVSGWFKGVAGYAVALLSTSGLSPQAAVSRGTPATYFDAAGALQGVGVDVPRFVGPARRLLVEEQRTNLIRNPRGEGAVVGALGSGGSLPTNWSVTANAALTTSVVATGVENNVPYVRLRFVTTGDLPGNVISLNPETSITAAPSTTHALSWFARLVSGTAPALRLGWQDGTVTQYLVPSPAAMSSTALTRHATTATTAAGGSTARDILGWLLTAGVTYDFTVDVALPQLAVGSFPTSPILPLVGAPAATNRSADDVTAELGAWFRNGATVTNHFTNSDDMALALGTKSGVTVGSDATTAPDGSANGDLLVESASTGGHYAEKGIALRGDQTLTYSIYVKYAGRSTVWLEAYSSDYASVIRQPVLNLDTTPTLGTPFGSGVAAPTGSIVPMSNGWYRVSMTGVVSNNQAATVRVRVALINGSTTYAGDGASGVHLWGGQLTVGQHAAYLATASSTASRQQCGPGTIVVEVAMPNGMQSTLPLVSLNDGTSNDGNSLVLRVNSGGSGVLGVNKTNGNQANTGALAPLAPATLAKVAIAWSEEGYTVVVDGGAPSTLVHNWAMWAFSRLAIGRLPAPGAGYANAEFAKVEYRPVRLPASTLQSLTS